MTQTVHVNVSESEIIRARLDAFAGGALDAKRPQAWIEYGYPDVVDIVRLRRAYDRGGVGHGAVHRLLDRCWRDTPRIKAPASDKESDWEKKTEAVLKAIHVMQKLRDLDRRNMVGRYAGLIYRVKDGRKVDQPLGRGELVDIIPVFEDQLKVTRWDSDLNSPTFGRPLMWQYRARNPMETDTQAQPDRWEDLHPSRVQILAEGAVGDDFFDGVPLLKAGFNALIDIEKITGGSAESFLKNSARTITFQFDKDSSPQLVTSNTDAGATETTTLAQALEDKTRKLNRSIDASVAIAGGQVGTLQTTISNPEYAFGVAANVFAASVQIPFTILFGQQTGRLASDEDQTDFNARCASRRTNVLTPAIEEFVSRMQACGAIDPGEFEVEWQDLDAPSDDAKLDRAKKMAEINKSDFDTGGNGVFDGNEVRKAAGYEERTGLDELPGEGDPADDPASAPAAQGMPPAPQQQAPGQRPALRQAA